MKTFLVLIFLVVFALPEAIGQCGNEFFVISEGTEWEMSSYDSRGRLQSRQRSKVVSVVRDNGAYRFTIESIGTDSKGAELPSLAKSYEMICEDGLIKFDFSQFVPTSSFGNMPATEVIFSGENLEYPSRMQVGQKLNNARVGIRIESVFTVNMEVIIADREVVALETITTEAGSFECYKVTSTTQTRSRMVNTDVKAADWIAKNVGVVRSETFDRNGRSQGYSELTYFKAGK